MHPETVARAVRFGAESCIGLVHKAVARDPDAALTYTREFETTVRIPGTDDVVRVLARIEPKP